MAFQDWIDRVQANPRFRRAAAAFPLSRPVARARARALFDLCAGFVYTQVLTACVRLDLFEKLAAGPRQVADLAPALGLSEAATTRLLDAAVSLRLVRRRGRRGYGLGDLGCAMLGDAGIPAMVAHHAKLYADLRDPVAVLRGESPGNLAGAWPYAGSAAPDAVGGAAVADYTRLMAASQSFIAEEVVAAYDFRAHRCVLDVGGGNGTFLSAVAKASPASALMVLDLPAVAAEAEARFAASGLAARARAIGGDAIAGPIPRGADLITFIRVLHDHNDDAVLSMLRHAHAALPQGGGLLIAEPLSGTPGAEPIGDAYFGFYFLAMGQGRSRTRAELSALVEQAGFAPLSERRTALPILVRVLTTKRIT